MTAIHATRTVRVGAAIAFPIAFALACAANTPPAAAPVGDAARGAQLAAAKNCVSCHSPDGSHKAGPTWQAIWGQPVELTRGSTVTVDAGYVTTAIRQPNAQVVAGYAPNMPTIPLTDAEVADITEYIHSLAAKS